MSHYTSLAEVETDRYVYYMTGTRYFIGQSSYELRLAIYPETEEVEFMLKPELDLKFRLHYRALPFSIAPVNVLSGDFLYTHLPNVPDLLDAQLQEFRRVYEKEYSFRAYLKYATVPLNEDRNKVALAYQGAVTGTPERMMWLTCVKYDHTTAYFFSFHNTLTGQVLNFGANMLHFDNHKLKHYLSANTPDMDILAEMVTLAKGVPSAYNENFNVFHAVLRQLYIDEALKDL